MRPGSGSKAGAADALRQQERSADGGESRIRRAFAASATKYSVTKNKFTNFHKDTGRMRKRVYNDIHAIIKVGGAMLSCHMIFC